MKKVILIMAVALSAATVSAQGLKFGVTAGLNIPSFSGDLGKNMESTFGFQAGVVADYGLTESFSIAPELLFSQRGAKPKSGGDAITLSYLQLPINATYKIAVNDNSKVLVFAGPYVGYGISSSEEKPYTFGSVDDGNMLNPLDFGLNIGAGYQFGSIFAKAQYNLGLTNVLNKEAETDGSNGNIAITVGYLF